MKKIKLIALFGESGAGKDSIRKWFTTYKNVHGVISHTTRPPRDGEEEGDNHHFISTGTFIKLLAEQKLLEFAYFNNWYYGTSIDQLQIDKINIGVFDPTRIRRLLKHSDKIEILPVWIQSYGKERLLRSLQREKAPSCEEICRRFLADKEDFSNIDFDYEIYFNLNSSNSFHGFLNRPKIKNFLKGVNLF